MDNYVVVLNNVSVIFEHHFVSLKLAVDKVNDGDAWVELENNGTGMNMFIRENKENDRQQNRVK